MMVYESQKTIRPEKIYQGSTDRQITGCRTAEKLLDTDLILAMDRSGSMGGQALYRAVQAAIAMVKSFTACEKDCCLPGKSRMGLISYAERATMEVPLENCTVPTQKALKQLKAGGNTNYSTAIELAGEMLTGSRAGRKILILFTDGGSNCGCPETAARKLREQKVEIFCIGLGIEACDLRKFASQPWKDHIALAENFCALDSAFRRTGEKILDACDPEGRCPCDCCPGTCQPEDCCPGTCRTGDCCPIGCCAVAEPCRDGAECCCGEARLSGLGRVVEVHAVIRDVCPGKRVGAAVILTEVDPLGKEHNLGMKTYEIPPQKGEACRDVNLSCIQFVVPESTRVWGCCESLCSPRCFRARVIANYLDTDYQCCESLCEI